MCSYHAWNAWVKKHRGKFNADELDKKTDYDLPFAIEKSDFVAIVSTAWGKAFQIKKQLEK